MILFAVLDAKKIIILVIIIIKIGLETQPNESDYGSSFYGGKTWDLKHNGQKVRTQNRVFQIE